MGDACKIPFPNKGSSYFAPVKNWFTYAFITFIFSVSGSFQKIAEARRRHRKRIDEQYLRNYNNRIQEMRTNAARKSEYTLHRQQFRVQSLGGVVVVTENAPGMKWIHAGLPRHRKFSVYRMLASVGSLFVSVRVFVRILVCFISSSVC